jgi:hypothetical protein
LGIVVSLRNRSTTDLVVLAIIAIVGVILILTSVGVMLVEIFHPEVDTDPIIEAESEILAVLVGALVGFVGGRHAGRSEAEDERDG